MKYLLAALFLLSLQSSAQAECMAERGNCCKETNDCTVIFHPAYCAIVSVNKKEAKKQSETTQASFCQGDIVRKLKDGAKSEKPICFKGQCELDQDNG